MLDLINQEQLTLMSPSKSLPLRSVDTTISQQDNHRKISNISTASTDSAYTSDTNTTYKQLSDINQVPNMVETVPENFVSNGHGNIYNQDPTMFQNIEQTINQDLTMYQNVEHTINQDPTMYQHIEPTINQDQTIYQNVNPTFNQDPTMYQNIEPSINQDSTMYHNVEPIVNQDPTMYRNVESAVNQDPTMYQNIEPAINQDLSSFIPNTMTQWNYPLNPVQNQPQTSGADEESQRKTSTVSTISNLSSLSSDSVLGLVQQDIQHHAIIHEENPMQNVCVQNQLNNTNLDENINYCSAQSPTSETYSTNVQNYQENQVCTNHLNQVNCSEEISTVEDKPVDIAGALTNSTESETKLNLR